LWGQGFCLAAGLLPSVPERGNRLNWRRYFLNESSAVEFEWPLLNPVETAADKEKLVPIKESKLNVKPLAIHIANQRELVRRRPLKRKTTL
jgi:hypothetical protein